MAQDPNGLWRYETLSIVLLRVAADHGKAMTASHTIPVHVGTAPVCAQMLALQSVLPAHIGNRQGQVLVDLDLELPRRCRRSHPLAMAEGHPATIKRMRRWSSKAAACGNQIQILYMTARTVPTVTAAAAIFSTIGAAHETAAVGVVVVVVNVSGANNRREELLLIRAIIRQDEVAQHLPHDLHEATQSHAGSDWTCGHHCKSMTLQRPRATSSTKQMQPWRSPICKRMLGLTEASWQA